jgi:hypothetical protein
MIMGKLTFTSVTIDGPAYPVHQSYIFYHNCYSFGVYGKRVCYYSNILVKIVVIEDT